MTVQEFLANGGRITKIPAVEFEADRRVKVKGKAWAHDKSGDAAYVPPKQRGNKKYNPKRITWRG